MYDAIHFTRFVSLARRKSQVSLADGHEPLHLSGRAAVRSPAVVVPRNGAAHMSTSRICVNHFNIFRQRLGAPRGD
jgi:hypothetical protein